MTSQTALDFQRKIEPRVDDEFWFSFLMKVERLGDGHLFVRLGANGFGKPWGNGSISLGDERTKTDLLSGKTYHWVLKGKKNIDGFEYRLWLDLAAARENGPC